MKLVTNEQIELRSKIKINRSKEEHKKERGQVEKNNK
jgi:hypothetical protein